MSIEDELAALRAELREERDRREIHACIVRESRARDRQDAGQIAGCWWEDGVDEHGPMVTFAPEYPEKANAQHRGSFHMTSHNITNHLCDLDGDTAYCESYVIGGLHRRKDGLTTIAFGRYLDQLERRNGEWRLVTRRCTMEMTADGDPSWLRTGAVSGFLKALWSTEDPSYERPIRWKPKDQGVRW